MAAGKGKKAPALLPGQPAPALIRSGVYNALGASLFAAAVAGVVLWLNPAPRVSVATGAGGCGCGCGGSATGQQAKVYG